MQLVKLVFAFIAVGGASYAIFRFERDGPLWLKAVTILLTAATVIGALVVLPQAVQGIHDAVGIGMKWWREGLRQEASAPSNTPG